MPISLFKILNCLYRWCLGILKKSITKHFSHLQEKINIIKQNRLIVSTLKVKLCQIKIRFSGYNIYQGSITPINRGIEFVDKFPNEIKDQTQLQRFLRFLNYVFDSPPPYMSTSLQETQEKIFFLESSNYQNCQISQKSSLKDFLIVKTDASNTGYGEILKHKF